MYIMHRLCNIDKQRYHLTTKDIKRIGTTDKLTSSNCLNPITPPLIKQYDRSSRAHAQDIWRSKISNLRISE